jgi:PAS domain S-box-containing protein
MLSAAQETNHILNVQSAQTGAVRTGEILEQKGGNFAVETVATFDEGLARITDRPPDCVVAVDDAADRDGLDFLDNVRTRQPDLPVVLVGNENEASRLSQVIEAGATDYVPRGTASDHPDILVHRIQRAISHSQLTTRLQSTRDEYSAVFDSAQEGLMLVDIEGDGFCYRRCNPRAEELIGRDRTDIVGESPKTVLGPSDGQKVIGAYRACIEEQAPVEYDVTLDLPVGEVIRECQVAPVTRDGAVEQLVVSFHDVTKRRRQRAELEAERQLIQESLDALEDVFYVLDTEGHLVRWNERVPTVSGFDEATLEGIDAVELFPEDEREKIATAIETTVQEGEVLVEADLLTSDGERIPHEFKGRRVTDDEGTITDLVGIGRDLTERRTHEQRFQALVEESNDIISIVDASGRFQYQSPSLERILGYGTDETLGDRAWEYIHPEDRDRVKLVFQEWITATQAPDPIEYRARHADGSWRWMEARGNNQLDNSAVGGYIINSRDITERKRRERELGRKTRAIEEAPVGITITDPSQPDNPMIYVNERFVTITGYEREEVLERNCRFLQGEQTSKEPVEAMREAIQRQSGVSTEIRNYRKDGTQFWNRVDIAPVHDESGELVNYVGFQRDITERKEREQAIEESRNRYRTLVENYPNGAVALVDQNLKYTTVGGTTVEGAEVPISEIMGQRIDDVLPAEITEIILPHYEAALDGETRHFEESIGDRVYQFRIIPVRDDDGSVFAAMGVSQDITERKQRLQALEKRERILRELHTATREFYPPDSEGDIAQFLVEFIEKAFSFDYVSVKQFDEASGHLEPAAWSSEQDDASKIGAVTPNETPIWGVFREGESRILEATAAVDGDAIFEDSLNQLLVVPIGDFGVIVAYTTGHDEFGAVDMELIEVVAANAESSYQRLRSDKVRSELVGQLSTQQRRVDELQRVIEVIQSIQQRLADSDSQEALETGVCEQLLKTDAVDFVWLGRPQGRDASLRPTAWAGDKAGYLDAVNTTDAGAGLPAQRAASTRESYTRGDITSLVVDEPWAKEALSANFHSVVSVPLVYDEVVYGVLTAYSRAESAFDQVYQYLITDVASLLVNYSRILEQRYDESRGTYTELEFELRDPRYPLHRLATDTGCRLRLETILENMTDKMRALVTVVDGDTDAILDAAAAGSGIVDARQLGDGDSSQLTLTVQKPFLASVVGKHGGTLVQSVSDCTETRFTVELQNSADKRPLLDSLSSEYQEIEPVAQRQRDSPLLSGSDTADDVLTDRQYEILNAAYHGGYYETPRQITGEDLAESFDISNPAIYNHLQSAHRRLLGTIVFAEGYSQ